MSTRAHARSCLVLCCQSARLNRDGLCLCFLFAILYPCLCQVSLVLSPRSPPHSPSLSILCPKPNSQCPDTLGLIPHLSPLISHLLSLRTSCQAPALKAGASRMCTCLHLPTCCTAPSSSTPPRSRTTRLQHRHSKRVCSCALIMLHSGATTRTPCVRAQTQKIRTPPCVLAIYTERGWGWIRSWKG